MSQVQLILVESIHNLGEAGDLVKVKPGFARNYLLPQGKAILATAGRVQELEHNKRIAEEKAARELTSLKAVKKQLEGLDLQIGARAGDGGKLFGSVTAANIAEKVEEAGIPIDRRRIDLRDPIKEVGEHKVTVKLLRELSAELTVKVIGEGGPAIDDDDVEDFDDRSRRREQDEDAEADAQEETASSDAASDGDAASDAG
ncbi:MAG: 50S ribosomal protein L9 [Myxococcota bacterium]